MMALPQNPFTRPAFWGRENELKLIFRRLSSTPPQCCALIGETSFGKTSLLRHLARSQNHAFENASEGSNAFTFVYLDCISYVGANQLEDQASARFWWDLYRVLRDQLHQESTQSPSLEEMSQLPLDRAFELKSLVEDLIREQTRPVVFLFDNFEGIAHLPLHNSMWLRALAQYPCAYVVASRHLLYLQYNAESWASPSPLWNLFTEPLYIELMAEDDVDAFLQKAKEQAAEAESLWTSQDICFIKNIAGRHPELIRIACTHLFEQRLRTNHPLKMNAKDLFEITSTFMLPICQSLWKGLNDSELWNIPSATSSENKRMRETSSLSSYQKVLIELAHEREVRDEKLLYVLAQRGLIERRGERWSIFAEAMRWFVLEQEAQQFAGERSDPQGMTPAPTSRPGDPPGERSEMQPLTHLEEKVYQYLRSHMGKVCDREEIKQAVWEQESELPGNSALQKIIERIRKKIEPEPDNPHYLIAVRGRGYMLRENLPERGSP